MSQPTQKRTDVQEVQWEQAMVASLDAGPLPPAVQARLDRTYAALGRIPQEPPRKSRRGRIRTSFLIAAVITCALFAGAAFAATSFLSMSDGDGEFFAANKSLPVFESMEAGAKALSADVGQTFSNDGVQIVLDSVSCDRNVANLYVTLTKEGGFDLEGASAYQESQEATWPRLQSLMPFMSYTIQDETGATATGIVNSLDAYLEGDAIKGLLRITPEKLMGEEALVTLEVVSFEEGIDKVAFVFGLDMRDITAPRELAPQDVAFQTPLGERILGIERFTASELGTVMVTSNDRQPAGAAASDPNYEPPPSTALDPYHIMITDDLGNTLVPVCPGDGAGTDPFASYVTEYARLSPEATSLIFTPMLLSSDTLAQDVEHVVDVSQPGAKVETSEFGGYDVVGWEVADRTVTITLSPYGWEPSNGQFDLEAKGQAPLWEEPRVDPETGEQRGGLHSGLIVTKCDYETGDTMSMTFYYGATDAELEQMRLYRYYALPPGGIVACTDVAVSLELRT